MAKRIVTDRRYSVSSSIVKDPVGYNYVTPIIIVTSTCYFHRPILFARYIIIYTVTFEIVLRSDHYTVTSGITVTFGIVRTSVHSEQGKNRHDEVAA